MADLVPSNEGSSVFGGQNALSVDVEDYYQVSAFEPHVDRSHWRDYECRLMANMDRILGAMDAVGAMDLQCGCAV